MRARLRAELDKKLQEWIDEQCSSDDWPRIWLHADMSEDMGDAAADLFDTVDINQGWLRREGYLSDV